MGNYPYTRPNVHPDFEDVQNFVNETMAQLAEVLPYSEEFDGLDFTDSKLIVAVNIEVVSPDGLYLSVRRSAYNSTHVGSFNNVAGFMTGKGKGRILDCVYAELKEEIGLVLPFSADIRVGEILIVDRGNGVFLFIVPAQVKLHDPHEVILNNEHTEFLWSTHEERMEFELVPIVARVRTQFAKVEQDIELAKAEFNAGIRRFCEITLPQL